MTEIWWRTLASVAGLAFLALLGFAWPIPRFPAPGAPARPPGTQTIPAGLPDPVLRYLRALSADGTTLPRIDRVTYSGVGRARPFGVWLPFRFRSTFEPGRTMSQVMEIPWFGRPLLHVEDTYDGSAGKTAISGLMRAEATGPEIDVGAYLALASASVLFPSAEALSGRWEHVDEHRARLAFAYRGGTERLTVSFDPATGLPVRIATPRPKGTGGDRIEWRIDLDLRGYERLSGLLVPTRFEVTWEDERGPWSTWAVEALEIVAMPSRDAAGAQAAPSAPTAP